MNVNERKVIDSYTHCGYTQELAVQDIKTYFGGKRLVIELEDTQLNLNDQQERALEEFFVQRRNARDQENLKQQLAEWHQQEVDEHRKLHEEIDGKRTFDPEAALGKMVTSVSPGAIDPDEEPEDFTEPVDDRKLATAAH